MLRSLAERFGAIEARLTALEDVNNEGSTDAPEQPKYPAWKPWDVISEDYRYGAVVTHNGQLWKSVYRGQNVWEPGAVGERFWKTYPIKNIY